MSGMCSGVMRVVRVLPLLRAVHRMRVVRGMRVMRRWFRCLLACVRMLLRIRPSRRKRKQREQREHHHSGRAHATTTSRNMPASMW